MDLGTPPKLGGEIFIFSLEVLFDTTAKISPARLNPSVPSGRMTESDRGRP